MNTTIWKYPFYPNDIIQLELPEGAELLSVQVQGAQPCVWALVDPAAPLKQRTLLHAGTGHTRLDLNDARYIGTYQLMAGALVFHVFEDYQADNRHLA